MNDWAGADEDRNYLMLRIARLQGRANAVAIVLLLAAGAGGPLAHLRFRTQIAAVEHEDQKIRSEMEAEMRTREKLISDEQDFKNPEHIDEIARAELGLGPLKANQILGPPKVDPIRAERQELAAANIPHSVLPR